jgi:hypothetical protein
MNKVYTTFGIVTILVAAFATSNAIKGHAALAITAEEIQLKNLVQSHKDINSGNATAAIDNILAVLDWEFKKAS